MWLARLSEYADMLTYGHVHAAPLWTGFALLGMLAAALFLRNKAMVFGWLFFLIAITPVALIPSRLGYVLYLPELGLGLYFAGALTCAARALARPACWRPGLAESVLFALTLGGATVIHAYNGTATVARLRFRNTGLSPINSAKSIRAFQNGAACYS
jgi:hypothetical protein